MNRDNLFGIVAFISLILLYWLIMGADDLIKAMM